jgi:deoxyribose-phosphate aldolase
VWSDDHKDMCFYRGADKCLLPEDIQEDMFEYAQCLHCGSITCIEEPGASAQRKALLLAREKGMMISYDPNYRPTLWPDETTAHSKIFDGFKYAHLVKISEEEFHMATGHENIENGIRAVIDQGADLVVVSRGEQGALASNGDYIVESPALKNIEIVETTGAGDGFLAALISRLLPEFKKNGSLLKTLEKGLVKDALDFGNIVGGLTCSKPGAIPSLPSKEEVDEFMATRNKYAVASNSTLSISPQSLANMIDHSFLKPNGESGKIEKLCEEAREFGFVMVAVNPAEIQRCVKLLKGTDVRVGAAIGFPLGQFTTRVKTYETRDAIQCGATEIDMVVNIRELQMGNYELIRREIKEVLQACKEVPDKDIACKVIFETCYLSDEQKLKLCKICCDLGVDYVKTSTGFGSGGATVKDVKLMQQAVGADIGVKASGGIQTLSDAKTMIAAGASRIGTSAGSEILAVLLEELRQKT